MILLMIFFCSRRAVGDASSEEYDHDQEHGHEFKLDGWQSGLMRTPGKRVCRKATRVRIPAHPRSRRGCYQLFADRRVIT